MLRAGGEPLHLEGARFILGRALWESGRDRERALGMVRQARAGLRETGEAGREDLAEVEAWLASHGGG